jgi:chromate reductase, NAD(P)H dehydrogenase (quinone)
VIDFHILGISGSLRHASFNSAALRTAQDLAPDGVDITRANISAIPVYNDDVREKGMPPSVMALVEQITTADALLIATPEYNYSVPGVLKNAIDWVSKATNQPFRHKPIAILGASMGAIGTARAQYDLRKMFVFLDAYILNQPEIMIAAAHTKFDADGYLTDEVSRKLIGTQIVALKEWALRLRD